MRISRSASCTAISWKVIGLPLFAGVCTANDGPYAVPSLRSDSISRKPVGNQIGPRQFELPPLIFDTASAGSYPTTLSANQNGFSSCAFDRLRTPYLDRNSEPYPMPRIDFSSYSSMTMLSTY